MVEAVAVILTSCLIVKLTKPLERVLPLNSVEVEVTVINVVAREGEAVAEEVISSSKTKKIKSFCNLRTLLSKTRAINVESMHKISKRITLNRMVANRTLEPIKVVVALRLSMASVVKNLNPNVRTSFRMLIAGILKIKMIETKLRSITTTRTSSTNMRTSQNSASSSLSRLVMELRKM